MKQFVKQIKYWIYTPEEMASLGISESFIAAAKAALFTIVKKDDGKDIKWFVHRSYERSLFDKYYVKKCGKHFWIKDGLPERSKKSLGESLDDLIYYELYRDVI